MSQPSSINDLNQLSQHLNKLEKGTFLYQNKSKDYFTASSSSEKKLKWEEILTITEKFVKNAKCMGDIETSLKKFKNRMKDHYYQGLCGLVYKIIGLFLSNFQFEKSPQRIKICFSGKSNSKTYSFGKVGE